MENFSFKRLNEMFPFSFCVFFFFRILIYEFIAVFNNKIIIILLLCVGLMLCLIFISCFFEILVFFSLYFCIFLAKIKFKKMFNLNWNNDDFIILISFNSTDYEDHFDLTNSLYCVILSWLPTCHVLSCPNLMFWF